MALATMNKFYTFTRDLATGVHNFSTDELRVCLTNTIPQLGFETYTTNVAPIEISQGNGYLTEGKALTGVVVAMNLGITTITANGIQFQATGGVIGPFRYAVLYNSTNDRLLGWYAYTSNISLQDTETFDFSIPSGLFDIT